MPALSPRHFSLLGFTLLFAIAAFIYAPGLRGEFMFDDYPNIVTNNLIQIDSLDLGSLKRAADSDISSQSGRPLSMLSFAVNHALTGLNPGAFKAVNLALHLLNGLLILSLTRLLTRRLYPDGGDALPLWVASAWILHPINVTPVLLVVQRMTEIATLFTLAGVLLHVWLRLRPPGGSMLRKGVLWLGVPLLWYLGFLGKETAVLAPLFVVLIEWFVLRPRLEWPRRSAISGRAWGWLALLGAGLGAVLALLASRFLTPEVFQVFDNRDFSLGERLMSEMRVLWFYVKLTILPATADFGLFHDDFPVSRGWLDPWTTLPAAAAWTAVVVWLIRQGRRAPLFSLGIGWFLAGHLLESTIIPLELVYEHRNYTPSFGLLLALGDLGRRLFAPVERSGKRWLAVVLALLPLLLISQQTAARAHAYGDRVRFTQFEVRNHPHSARAQQEAGNALILEYGDRLAAMPETRKQIQEYLSHSTAANPAFKYPLVAKIHLACFHKDPVDPAWTRELVRRWRQEKSVSADRNTMLVMRRYALAQALCLDFEEVSALYLAPLDNPRIAAYDRAMALVMLAQVSIGLRGDYAAARRYHLAALKVSPAANVMLLYAQFLAGRGEYEEVRRILEALPVDRYTDKSWIALQWLEAQLRDWLRQQPVQGKGGAAPGQGHPMTSSDVDLAEHTAS